MTERIEGKPKGLSLIRRFSYWFGKRMTAKVSGRRSDDAPEPVRIMGHRPLLMSAYGSMEMALYWSRALDPRLKELARARVGMIHGCPW